MGENKNIDVMDNGRKLSKEELRRKEKLESLTEELTAEGYTREDLTVSAFAANFKGFLVAIPLMFCEIVIYRMNYGSLVEGDRMFALAIAAIIFLLLVVVHESIHGITWGIFAEHHMKDIKFGVIWKMLTPYCTCASPLKRSQYIIGTAMPTIILGLGFFAVAMITGSFLLYAIALFNTLSGGGDMLIILNLCKYKSNGKEILIYDHPYEVGSIVFER